MTERFKLSLSGVWLLASLSSIVLPVFLPSNSASDVIGTATLSMFVLSFPSSLFALPFLIFLQAALNLTSGSVGTMYISVLVFFVLGFVQWFWIVPRIYRNEPSVQTLNLPVTVEAIRLPEAMRDFDLGGFDEQDLTPVERVIRDGRDQFS